MDPNDHGPGTPPSPSPRPPSIQTGVLSHRFIEALAPARDQLYAQAVAKAASPAAAESALQSTARKLFRDFSADPHLDVPAAMRTALATSSGAAGSAADADTPMPADAWARLAAAVQFEAASSAKSGALHPDSVLLQPDPLLAPKKTKPRADDTPFDVASPSRLITLLAVVLLAGLLITLYILTRPAASTGHPAPPNPATRVGGQ